MTNNKKLLLILLFSICSVSGLTNYAFASHSGDPNISFDFPAYSLNAGSNVFDTPVVITVTDSSLAGNGGPPDVVTVNLSSTSGGATTLSLTETGDTGTFVSTNLIFMENNQIFQVTDKVKITIIDNTGAGNADPDAIDTIPARINAVSDTDNTGIFVLMTETGKNTGEFTGVMQFSTISSDDVADILQVSPGDIISIVDNASSCGITNGMISPNPSGAVGAIIANVGVGAVTATYSTDFATIDITEPCTPGSGGGGFIRPGLILDVVVALSGNGGKDVSPPSFVLNPLSFSALSLPESILSIIQLQDPFKPLMPITDDSIEVPLRINDNGYTLYGYSQTIETATVKTGTPVPLQLILQDNSGVEHVALYTNIVGTNAEIQNSDTYIIYDEDEPLEIKDPHGFFSNVDFIKNKIDAKYNVLFNITFAKPMETSDIIFRLWDEKRNSGDTKIFDAIKVTGDVLNTENVQTDVSKISLPLHEDSKYIMPLPDSQGNLVFYNSFGDIENNKVHPYLEPFGYPDYVGRSERHDNGFLDKALNEELKSHEIVQKLIIDPFEISEKRTIMDQFNYPENVGKLDRKDKEKLIDNLLQESIKAEKIKSK